MKDSQNRSLMSNHKSFKTVYNSAENYNIKTLHLTRQAYGSLQDDFPITSSKIEFPLSIRKLLK